MMNGMGAGARREQAKDAIRQLQQIIPSGQTTWIQIQYQDWLTGDIMDIKIPVAEFNDWREKQIALIRQGMQP